MLYSLKYNDIEIVINSHGAEQESLNFFGKEYIRERNETWNRKAPILFPIVGKLRDLKTYINGNLYSMGQHGLARDKEFSLYEKTKNSITFLLEADEETLKMYPFDFQLFVKYTIEDLRVKVDMKVINKGKEDMLFNIGGHPGIALPMEKGLDFNDYTVEFEHVENFDAPTVSSNGTLNFVDTIKWENVKEIKLDYKHFEIDAIVVPHLKSRSVKLHHNGRGIKFDFYGFNSFAIWTRPGEKFVCLEPWLGYADHSDSDYEFSHKDDIQALKQNEEFNVGYSIEFC